MLVLSAVAVCRCYAMGMNLLHQTEVHSTNQAFFFFVSSFKFSLFQFSFGDGWWVVLTLVVARLFGIAEFLGNLI